MKIPIQSELLATRLESPLSRHNLAADTLGEAIGDEPTLLVFLRHLG